MATATPDIPSQLQEQRRIVDFDTFDIAVQQLLTMVERKAIHVAPKYQRKFRWDQTRCSQLIESLLLGIPIPSLFMATNEDASWELVDGVQRISSIAKFAGDSGVRERLKLGEPLRLIGLQKLTALEGMTFSDLPDSIRLHFETRPVKVVTLSDKSDMVVRFDLFQRLNTGGVILTPQEIRDCVYRGGFADFLDKLADDQNFRRVLRLQRGQENDGTREECILRFFAFLDSYKTFKHSVVDFLNNYMRKASANFDYVAGENIFRKTFLALAAAFPDGLRRPHRKGATSLILFEGVAVGAAMAIQKAGKLQVAGLKTWLGSDALTKHTTGATNDLNAVKGRIEYCRDRFLGK